MKWSVLCVLTLLAATACTKKVEKSGTTEATIEQIMKEKTVVEKELEIIKEKSRDDKYEILMNSSMGLGSKITASKDIMEIMNGMLTNKGLDATETSEELAEEFTLRLKDIHSRLNFKSLNALKANDHFETSFYAVAAELDGSFYELLKRSLKKEKAGKQLLAHEELFVSQDNREMIINLIEARVDILSAFALQNLTDKKKMNWWQRTKSFAFTISFGLIGAIDYPETYATANEATKNNIEDHLQKAVEAKKFLGDISVTKKLPKKMNAAFKEIDFGDKKKKSDESQEERQIDMRKELIKSLITQLVN